MKRGFLVGATVAAGAIMLIPGVAVALSRAGRPIMRAAVRSGAHAFREFQTVAAEIAETVEDLAAEFQSEVARPEQPESPPEPPAPETAQNPHAGPGTDA